jgi:hypothetical protein
MDWSLLCTLWNNHCSEWNVTSCSFKHKQHLCATEMSVKEWRFTIYRTTGASGNSGFHHCKLKFYPFPSYTRSQASSLIPWTFFSIIISLQTHGIDIQSSQPQNFETLFSNFPPCLSWFFPHMLIWKYNDLNASFHMHLPPAMCISHVVPNSPHQTLHAWTQNSKFVDVQKTAHLDFSAISYAFLSVNCCGINLTPSGSSISVVEHQVSSVVLL